MFHAINVRSSKLIDSIWAYQLARSQIGESLSGGFFPPLCLRGEGFAFFSSCASSTRKTMTEHFPIARNGLFPRGRHKNGKTGPNSICWTAKAWFFGKSDAEKWKTRLALPSVVIILRGRSFEMRQNFIICWKKFADLFDLIRGKN